MSVGVCVSARCYSATCRRLSREARSNRTGFPKPSVVSFTWRPFSCEDHPGKQISVDRILAAVGDTTGCGACWWPRDRSILAGRTGSFPRHNPRNPHTRRLDRPAGRTCISLTRTLALALDSRSLSLSLSLSSHSHLILTHSLPHSLPHSLTLSLSLSHSLSHSHSLTLTHSLTHSLTLSLTF